MPSIREPTDVVLLTHDRLPHLIRTLEALEARTRTPYRLTVVDNASGAETRSWLLANRARFERLVLRSENEHTPAFQHGIDATTSDPYVVTDPDLVVPEGDPDWLERMLALLDAHPEFGLIGMGLDPLNRPTDLPPESLQPATADGEIVEGDVGTWFQLLRRDALRVRYVTDGTTCAAVRRAGFKVGWTRRLRAHHLGWDDAAEYPEYLLRKSQSGLYTEYREIAQVRRPATFAELSAAGPMLALTRAVGVADEAVFECAWGAPVVGAATPSVTTARDAAVLNRLVAGAAGAIVLVAPPPDAVDEALRAAARVATTCVVLASDLAGVGGRLADELAPPGWRGEELPAAGDLLMDIAAQADAHAQAGFDTVEHRERWLALFAAGNFGTSARRLWRFVPETVHATASSSAVTLPDGVARWRPPAFAPPKRRTATAGERMRRALAYARLRLGR